MKLLIMIGTMPSNAMILSFRQFPRPTERNNNNNDSMDPLCVFRFVAALREKCIRNADAHTPLVTHTQTDSANL